MKNLLLVLLTIPLLFGSCNKDDDEVVPNSSNTWTKTFGGTSLNEGHSVKQTTDSGYIITGSTGNGIVSDVYLIKTDENGDSLWTKKFGGTDIEQGSSVQQTTDGGYIITGSTSSFGNGSSDVYLIKTDGNGTEQWTKTFGGTNSDQGLSVQQTTDGGYIITGDTDSLGNGLKDVYLIKTDGNGTEQWSKTFGGTDFEQGSLVQQTTDGGYIIIGSTSNGGNGSDYLYLIKTNENGDSLWTKTFGGTYFDMGHSVQQTTDGGYIITGQKGYYGNNGPSSDVYLIKTDVNGDSLWTRTFGGTNSDRGQSVQQTTDGGYIITGSTSSFGNGSSDVYLIKTDGNGTEQWTKTFGGTNSDQGLSVQQTTDGGYIITGIKYYDVYLIKTDENGDVNP